MTLTVPEESGERRYLLFDGDSVTFVVFDGGQSGSIKTLENPVFGFDSHDFATWEDAAWQ